SLRALFCLAFGAETNPRFAPLRSNGTSAEKLTINRMRRFARSIPGRNPVCQEPSGSFLFGFRCGSEPVVRPIAQQWHEERSDEVFPAATSLKRAYGLFFVWLSVRKRTRGSTHCAGMARAQKKRRQTTCAVFRGALQGATAIKHTYGCVPVLA